MDITTEIKKHYALIKISGRSGASARELLDSLQQMVQEADRVIDSGRNRIVFDLLQCNEINSSLISLFVRVSARVQEAQGWLKLIVPKENPHARHVLEIVGINSIAELYETEQEILRHVGDVK